MKFRKFSPVISDVRLRQEFAFKPVTLHDERCTALFQNVCFVEAYSPWPGESDWTCIACFSNLHAAQAFVDEKRWHVFSTDVKSNAFLFFWFAFWFGFFGALVQDLFHVAKNVIG